MGKKTASDILTLYRDMSMPKQVKQEIEVDKPKYLEIHQDSQTHDAFTLGEGYEIRSIRDGKVVADTGLFKRLAWLEEQVEELQREVARLNA